MEGSKALRQDRASKKLEEQKRGQLGEAAERNKQGGGSKEMRENCRQPGQEVS